MSKQTPAPATRIDLPAINLALDGPKLWQQLASSPDPSAALVATIRQACADVGHIAAASGFQTGYGHATHYLLSKPGAAKVLARVHAEGRKSGQRTLTLDDKSTSALASALSEAVKSAPAPQVNVAAAAAPIVNVHVPEPKPRRQLATELPDGRILMEDVADDA